MQVGRNARPAFFTFALLICKRLLRLKFLLPMIFDRLKTGEEVSDDDFDAMYAEPFRAISEFHFTPVEVAKTAARFLVQKKGAKVLDIGSGAGKFCMVGASCTQGHFTGVEQRESLYLLSEELSSRYAVPNVTFIHSNIREIKFETFDAVYFFNAFYENIAQSDPIDDSVALGKQFYTIYSLYLKKQLDAMPVGTRLATYFSYLDEIPNSYELQCTDFDNKLKMWVKTN